MLCLITAAIDSDDFQQELLGRIIQMRESTHTHTDSCVQLLAAARRASPVHFSITNIIGDKTKQKRKNTEEKENKRRNRILVQLEEDGHWFRKSF
jgi:hypothetical protein